MELEKPDILWGLLLVIIPVLVHLFQWRRFRKIPFTNVALLKSVVLQSRKSSKLKKLLLLALRVSALTALVLAFTKPYIPAQSKNSGIGLIYIDNSMSMLFPGRGGTLFQEIQEGLLQHFPQDKPFRLIDNQGLIGEGTLESLRKKLLDLSVEPVTNAELLPLRLSQELDNNLNISNVLLLTDGKLPPLPGLNDIVSGNDVRVGLIKPENNDNSSIDSLWISDYTAEEISLTVKVSRTGDGRELPLAIYQDGQLQARAVADLREKQETEVEFTLPFSPIFRGYTEISNPNITFDNKMYFSWDLSKPIKVLEISEENNLHLDRLFTSPEFSFTRVTPGALNPSQTEIMDVVIVSGLSQLSPALRAVIRQAALEGVRILIIPGSENALADYDALLRDLGWEGIESWQNEPQIVSDIRENHPLLEGVFEQEVTNFTYPETTSFLRLKGRQNTVLGYASGLPMLAHKEEIFLFTAPINVTPRSFYTSALMVPVFYNMARYSRKLPPLYFINEAKGTYTVTGNLQSDQVVRLKKDSIEIIPLQIQVNKGITLDFNTPVADPGHYEVISPDEKILTTLSFNTTREENRKYLNEIAWPEGILIYSNLTELGNDLKSDYRVHELWKWFVIFALLCLAAEMLILKYLP